MRRRYLEGVPASLRCLRKGSTVANKHRKRGDWKNVASAHNRTAKQLINGRGLSNIPPVTDTGSAAYRRLQRKLNHDTQR